MKQLPQVVNEARERANVACDASQLAWDNLNNIENPTMADLENWIEIRDAFWVAQQKFEDLLRHFLFG